MNCQTAREQILASDPSDLALSAHLVQCPACRALARRVTRLDRQLASLPIDIPPPPASLFEALEPACPLVRLPLVPSERPNRPEGARRKLALASSLAAALLLLALGLSALTYLRPGPPSPLADLPVLRESALRLETAAKRSRALADLADTLVARAIDAPEHATEAADRFEKLILTDLLSHARDVSPGEREETIHALRASLQKTAQRARVQAATTTDLRVSHALERMATSVREADRRLSLL